MKKIISIMIIFILIFNINITTYADDLDEEDISKEEVEEELLDVSTNVENMPKINSRAVLVFDRTSKKVIYEKNGYTKRAMASTTKIMTAIVVLENANLKDTVEISKKAGGTGGSRLGLKANDKITVNDLLYGLMLRSRKRYSSSTCRTCRRKCRRICKSNEPKSRRIRIKKYSLCNTTWARPRRTLYNSTRTCQNNRLCIKQ